MMMMMVEAAVAVGGGGDDDDDHTRVGGDGDEDEGSDDKCDADGCDNSARRCLVCAHAVRPQRRPF